MVEWGGVKWSGVEGSGGEGEEEKFSVDEALPEDSKASSYRVCLLF